MPDWSDGRAFSKVLSIVTFYCKCTRALTFKFFFFDAATLHQRGVSERSRENGSGEPGGGSGGVKDPSNDGVLSANELQEQDRARMLKRLITSRTSRPHTTIKGYLNPRP
jgi:hypothetical protein